MIPTWRVGVGVVEAEDALEELFFLGLGEERVELD